MALFSMAIPAGSALGYVAGGAMGQAWGWRNAFYLVGLPGLILMILCLRLKDPARAPEPAPAPSAAPSQTNAD